MSNEDQSNQLFPRIAPGTFDIGGSFDAAAYVSESIQSAERTVDFPELPAGLFPDTNNDLESSQSESRQTATLAEAFAAATGWTLSFDEAPSSLRRRARPGHSRSPSTGRIYIDDMSADWPAGTPCVSRMYCDRLALRISDLVNQYQLTRIELAEARARLGTTVTASDIGHSTDSSSSDLARRLQSLLGTTINTAAASSAAFYVLDEEARFLNLSACSGIGQDDDASSIAGQRELAECIADIEALAGHAIVMTSPDQVMTWNSPVHSRSAICLPVASASTIIGTLWIFNDKARDYEDGLINMLEIIAGRIAAEVECVSALMRLEDYRDSTLDEEALLADIESLLSETSDLIHRNEYGDWFAFNETDSRVQAVNPPFEGWSLRGTTGYSNGKFLTWDVTDDERIRITTGLGTCSEESSDFVSVLIDPLTCDFEVAGQSRSAGIFVCDMESNQLVPVGQWGGSSQLTSSLALVAATTGNIRQAQQLANRMSAAGQHGSYGGEAVESHALMLSLCFSETKVNATKGDA